MLIESPPHESEAEFRAFVLELVAEIYGCVPAWFEFSVGARSEFRGALFRLFSSTAGSVSGQIYRRACAAGGLSRRILLQGTRSGVARCTEIHAGLEKVVDCAEIRAA